MRKLTALFFLCLTTSSTFSIEPVPFTVNTKKWSHVLDEHFISITINPTDLLQGKVFGLTMNSTMAILKGLAPAYVRIGSADTAKYTFKKTRHLNDMIKPDDEYTVTEAHWMAFNEVAQSAGLNVIVCLNAAHRIEGSKKWDTRNSLELISFSDSQGYNLTWQLGYEIQSGDELSGVQFGKDLNRLRTILNAFPRYQHSKLIGPDIRVIHKKEDVDFWNDVLVEAGPTLDAVTWHPRWPQPSKMKVSENSELGYEFPTDYLEWDRLQLNKILQRSIFKNPVWIGETKRESTGTFAEGLIWAKRLLLAAKVGVEVVMKQPNLMDITHPKPEYWIALLHKRLLGKSVLETRSVSNNTDLSVISHCTNPYYWTDKPEKLQDGPITVYAINMGGLEQKIQVKGTWTGKSQLLFQYVLTSGSDPDSVFSQMTYLNGEPLMMTDEGTLPEIIPKIKKLERGLIMKLPPYSIGFWVVPEAKVKICQVQPQNLPSVHIETLTPSTVQKSQPNQLKNIEDINHFIVEKLKNLENESEEKSEVKIEEEVSSESTEKDINLIMKENNSPRVARKIREAKAQNEIDQLRAMVQETQNILGMPFEMRNLNKMKFSRSMPAMEHRVYTIAEGISDALKTSNQQHEFNKFLENAGLKQDFGTLLMEDRRVNAPGVKKYQPIVPPSNFFEGTRYRRSAAKKFDSSSEEMFNDKSNENLERKFKKKITLIDEKEENEDEDPEKLEGKYKSFLQVKHNDSKKKLDDIKKKIKQDATDISQKIKSPQEIEKEIIKKEIEILSKAEEAVADIFSNQKKRQETIEDIIFDELNGVKDERINALLEIQKSQKSHENTIHKRHSLEPLSGPLLKTMEYIEKNLDLEPEGVKKIKRSLEERMVDFLKSYDTRKNAEIKKRTTPKEERKISRKVPKDEHKSEIKREKNIEASNSKYSDSRDETREKNIVKKPIKSSSKSITRISKKHTNSDASKTSTHISKKSNEPTPKSKKSEEQKNNMENDSFELFNAKEFEIPEDPKKLERKQMIQDIREQRLKTDRKSKVESSSKSLKEASESPKESQEKLKVTEEDKKPEEKLEKKTEEKTEEIIEEKIIEKYSPIKNDKKRRANVLKQISSIVDNMNSMEKDKGRLKRMNFDEDISNEFEPERKYDIIKRRPRDVTNLETIKETKEENLNEKISEEANKKIMMGIEKEVSPKKEQENNEKLGTELVKEKSTVLEKEISSNKMEGKETEKELIKEKSTLTEKNIEKPGAELVKEKSTLGEAPKENLHLQVSKETSQIKGSEKPLTEVSKGNSPSAPTEIVMPPSIEKMQEKPVMEDKLQMEKSKAEMAKETNTNGEEMATNEGATTNISKIKKRRRLRKRPSRKQKMDPTLGEDELPQKKRHLLGLQRPHYDMEKKKFIVPKLRKINPKFARIENEFPEDKKTINILKNDEATQLNPNLIPLDQQKTPEQVISSAPISNANQEIMQEIQQIVNEQHFLGQRLKTTNEELKTSGEKLLEKKPNTMDFATIGPTEKHVLTKPTEEKRMTTESITEKPKNVGMINENVESKKYKTEPSTKTTEKVPVTPVETLSGNKLIQEKKPSSFWSSENIEVASQEDSAEVMQSSEEVKKPESDFVMSKTPDLVRGNFKKEKEPFMSHRKRRATFLKTHKGTKEEKEDDDFSSEERIKQFKQMIYRKAPNSSKKPVKNEVHSIASNLGADEFLRMAGSTVKVVFDDVIPEAYGQTKSKIQNMGLSEYIKEFGNLVQQMRNLDQIFLNIGEAAVKGYIKGNKPEKGPYIQVISRKKREATENIENKENESSDETKLNQYDALMDTIMKSSAIEMKPRLESKNARPFQSQIDSITDGSFAENEEYATTSTEEAIISAERRDARNFSQSGEGYREMAESDIKTGEGMVSDIEETTETFARSTPIILDDLKPESLEFMPENDLKEKNIKEQEVDKLQSNMKSKKQQNIPMILDDEEMREYVQDLTATDLLNSSIKDDLKENMAPWIKTTKDFIQQALTTLQRQRQLSEILKKKDGINFIKKDSQKNLGKREILVERPKLPVYHMLSPTSNRKRDTQKQKQSDESLIRHLRGLQPGVYVVPTDEMTNVRSEQITNEAKAKSGMPNVVTLNIYYDKKNQDGSEKVYTSDSITEPRISQEAVTYYQNKAWNSAASHYDQNNQFVSPIATQEIPISTPVVASVPVAPVFTSDPRVAEIPNSRLVQYPSTNYHFPATQKIITSVVPNSQPIYSPVVYVQPEPTYVPQPPSTKRAWRDFKVPGSGLLKGSEMGFNSGWNLQYGIPPSNSRKASKTKFPASSYNTHYKAIGDKKRSVGDFKINPTWSESALPFWKFFTTSSTEQKEDKGESEEAKEKQENTTTESDDSSEDIFTENRKRAKEALLKSKAKLLEAETQKQVEDEQEIKQKEDSKVEKPTDNKVESRRKRSIENPLEKEVHIDNKNRKLVKRSYPYDIDFDEHDVLPQWFGAYQEVDNTIDDLPTHIRRSHIVSTPWSDEEEQLISSILEADDELAMFDIMDDDYFYSNGNTLNRRRRHPRSTDSQGSNTIRSNKILKTDDLKGKRKVLSKATLKKITDSDSSLEMVSDPKISEIKTKPIINQLNIQREIQKLKDPFQVQQQMQQPQPKKEQLPTGKPMIPESASLPNTLPIFLQEFPQPSPIPSDLIMNVTSDLPRIPNDDAFYYFFKYAYDSFVRVMKSMSELF